MGNRRLTDRAFVISLIDNYIPTSQGRPSATDIAVMVEHDLEEMEIRGNLQAKRSRKELQVPTLIQLAGQRLRQGSQVGIGWNGSHVDVPSRLAVPIRDEDGVPTKNKQYPMWVYESWEEVQALRDGLAAQRDGIDASVQGLEQVLKLREKYPDALTPFDACEMAGIDPAEIRVA